MIKQNYLEKIKGNNVLKAAIIAANDVHPGTVERWIRDNEEILTTAKNLSIISKHLKVKQDELLEKTAA